MKTTPTIPLPISRDAFTRFGREAKAAKLPLEVYLDRLSHSGFGMPLANLLGEVLSDAANARALPPSC